MDQDSTNKNIISISPYLNGNFKKLKRKMIVFLTDLKGQILIEQQNTEFIDITNQPKGCYIAFLLDLNGSLIKRIRVIKE